ncbi:MAG: hypothetical protein IJA75_07995, partial [Oscillospiraceae bacterium]|nr:hypothetical protein [Oscillospiraceae bacterium]
ASDKEDGLPHQRARWFAMTVSILYNITLMRQPVIPVKKPKNHTKNPCAFLCGCAILYIDKNYGSGGRTL